MRKKSENNGLADSVRTTRQVPYQRGYQKEGSPNYVLLYSEDDQSDDEEFIPLKLRSEPLKSPRKVEVINVQVQSDDTLQALALRYSCTISEIKRINKIHKDNEIFAHQFVKVPVQPFSLLTESLEENSEVIKQRDICNQSPDLMPLPSASKPAAIEINAIILNSNIEPIISHVNNENLDILENTDETDKLIHSVDYIQNNSSINFVNAFKCSGADWGLSWLQLLCVSLIFGFAVPIIYILYIAENPPNHSSHGIGKVDPTTFKYGNA